VNLQTWIRIQTFGSAIIKFEIVMVNIRFSFISLPVIILLLWSCSDDNPSVSIPVNLSNEWITGNLEEANIGNLDDAIMAAEEIPRFTSLLMVRDGKLVLEEYFHGFHADSIHDVRSVTKSIVSTLTGIALDVGFISSIDETLEDHLPANEFDLTAEQKNISIRHLLTMSSGFQWNEWTSTSYNDWILSGDHTGYLLGLSQQSIPGSEFTYNSAAVHLLGVVIEKAVGMKLYDFANQYLFDRIGVGTKEWELLSDGYVNAGSGLDLSSRDLARFGQLILQKGRSGNQTIVSESWVTDATDSKFSWSFDYGALKNYSYGYLWWTPPDAILAWGYGGQFIYIVPDKNLVIVTTVNWHFISSDGGPASTELAALDVIINKILPKVM
jgi:CubicO group peptidase (beta-lactamase class C family)